MNNNTTTSDFQLCPSPAGQEFFRNFDSESPGGDFRAVKYHQNPRKKRTKLIRIDNPVTKVKYGKKPDPSAPKITPPCSECGKKFWSWKALFGHMRCHPERQWRGINPPPNFRRPVSWDNNVDDDDDLEARMTEEEDHEVVTCLLMLANGPSANSVTTTTATIGNQGLSDSDTVVGPLGVNCRFECSSCKKVFGSHQALGGHRASHKNVKGCFAITRNEEGEEEEEEYKIGGHCDDRNGEREVKDKMLMDFGHKCSICSRVFSSGRALGGHKRCHWEKGDEPWSLNQGLDTFGTKEACCLDLNLPAPLEDYSSALALDLRLGL